jgi:hypothetical protein
MIQFLLFLHLTFLLAIQQINRVTNLELFTHFIELEWTNLVSQQC